MSAFRNWVDAHIGHPNCVGPSIDDMEAAFQAGRAYQREVDAKIAAGRPYIWSHEVAKAIREQKIDD